VVPRVGDRVQWTSGGVNQLPGGSTIVWISDDGAFARVDGSQTGIPVPELTILVQREPLVVEPGTVFT
jgi:hypothetical protein